MSSIATDVAEVEPLAGGRTPLVSDDESKSDSTIPRRDKHARAPLSFSQQRLWFLDQWQPNSPAYNMANAVRIRGPLDVAALEKAFSEVIARHEVLRTRFVALDGEPVQEISPVADFRMEITDLRDRGATQAESELPALLQQSAEQPFDLANDLMIRVRLFTLDPLDHALLINMHHIASDAWSFGILFREVSQLYEGFLVGESPSLPHLPIQYADYAAWQRERFRDDLLAPDLSYWREQLKGAPELLELPTDRPRPPVQTFRGGAHNFTVSAALAGGLKKIQTQGRVTQFMLLLAAFQTLLRQYSRQDDIVIGSPTSGRQQLETEELIGFFINTLVLRTDFSGDPTFLELLGRVRNTALDAYSHQELPFEKLVQELKPERTPSYSPLVQTMFVLQSAPRGTPEFGDATLEFINVQTDTAKFDLILSMAEWNQGFEAEVKYNADLFDHATIQRFCDNFVCLLEAIARNPRGRISELALPNPAERRQVVLDWNQTRRPYPREASLAELFEAQVERAPDSVALEHSGATLVGRRGGGGGSEIRDSVLECGAAAPLWNSGATLTYRQLNERANRLAHYLRQQGVQPETPVAVFLERGFEMIVTFLAIIKAGGAYMPVDRSYPAERIAFMLEDARAPLLITQEKLLGEFQATPGKVLCLERDAHLIEAESSENPKHNVTGGNLAYIIYTSGSTGTPKGVCIQHRSVARLVLNTDFAQLNPSDVMAQVSNCSFDAATWEIWGALLNSARLVILPSEILLSPTDFAEHLRARKITSIFVTAGLFNQIAVELPTAFSSLRHLIYGGEAADPKAVRAVLRHGPPERLLNGYGPTETTTFATWHHVRHVPDDALSIPIGRPIANTTAYILDEHFHPVPIGVPGELFLGGDGVARGYLHRPELNAQKFVPDPFSGDPAARLYKTGDLARFLPSGEIEFLARLDGQVKVRGFRVELGEIEAVLSQHPCVRVAVVLARPDASGAKQLVAYCATGEEAAPPVAEMRAFLQAKLPAYMVPSYFVFLPELPLTENGKVDRRALPAPDANQDSTASKRAEPRDEVERQLQEIWEGVLGVAPIGMQANFFELGGHSLLAVRLVAQIQKKFSRKLLVPTIFQHPTIEQLAGVLRDEAPASRAPTLVPIQPQGDRAPLLLVHGVGGGMFWGYSNLARHLGTDQPLYAIQSRGMDGQTEFETIEEMAADYVAKVRAFQPHGPYYLGGYCFGGLVAYEMARILRGAGEPIGLVLLLNTSPPNSSYTTPKLSPTYAARCALNLCHWFADTFRWTPERRREFIRGKAILLRKWFANPFARHVAADEPVEDWLDLSAYPEHQKKLWEDHIRALRNHHPQKFAGPVTLLRSRTHHLRSSCDPQFGWSEFVDDLEVQIVPGNHELILEEPNVRTLARQVRACLDRAQKF